MVLDQRVFVTFNPFNVYVTQGATLFLSYYLCYLYALNRIVRVTFGSRHKAWLRVATVECDQPVAS